MAEPTKTEQGKLIDEIRRLVTRVEGEMAERDYREAAVQHKELGWRIIDLTNMIAEGYDATRDD